MAGTLHIVHDNARTSQQLSAALADQHPDIRTYATAEAFLDEAVAPEGCVFVAHGLGGIGARGLIAAVRERRLPLRVVVLVAAADVAVAVALLRAGADDAVEETARGWRLSEAVRGAHAGQRT